MWLCLKEIFPEQLLAQAGVPAAIRGFVATYATHAYVLHGRTPSDSLAYQMTLDEGKEKWQEVLVRLRTADTQDVVAWGKKLTGSIEGKTKVDFIEGRDVYANSMKCFRSDWESTCEDHAQIQGFLESYRQAHPRFNLETDNCVMFACALLNFCQGKGACVMGDGVGSCQERLMWHEMKEKAPGCGMTLESQEEMRNNAPAQGLLDSLSDTLGAWGNFMMGRQVPRRVGQLTGEPPSMIPGVISLASDLADFMPMHNPTIQQEIMLSLFQADGGNSTEHKEKI